MTERTYLIAYEMPADTAVESRLERAITQSGGRWARPLSGVWYVETIDDIETLQARLAPLMSDEDGLVVQEVLGRSGVHNTLVRWTAPYPLSEGFDDVGRSRHPPIDRFARSGSACLSVVSSPL